jgi:tripartite-type tricarboxylate transporter receptor subunit TctC
MWVAVIAIALSVVAPAALSQAYPSKPIRLIVPYGTGGVVDAAARVLATKLAERFGQPVIVENRPGAETIIGTEAVTKAAADGYTLLFSTSSLATILPHTRKQLPYDPFKDLVHVTQIAHSQLVLAVNASLPVTTVADLVALARSRPGRLSYASGSEGAFIAAEMFKHSANVDIVHVPYKSIATITTELLAGEVDITFSGFVTFIPHFKSKRLKALAVTGEKRSPVLADVPTMAEAGLPGVEYSAAYGISAPWGIPAAVVARWNNEVVAVLKIPEVAEKYLALGLEPRFRTSEQFTAFLKAESDKQRRVLQRIGFKPE